MTQDTTMDRLRLMRDKAHPEHKGHDITGCRRAFSSTSTKASVTCDCGALLEINGEGVVDLATEVAIAQARFDRPPPAGVGQPVRTPPVEEHPEDEPEPLKNFLGSLSRLHVLTHVALDMCRRESPTQPWSEEVRWDFKRLVVLDLLAEYEDEKHGFGGYLVTPKGMAYLNEVLRGAFS